MIRSKAIKRNDNITQTTTEHCRTNKLQSSSVTAGQWRLLLDRVSLYKPKRTKNLKIENRSNSATASSFALRCRSDFIVVGRCWSSLLVVARRRSSLLVVARRRSSSVVVARTSSSSFGVRRRRSSSFGLRRSGSSSYFGVVAVPPQSEPTDVPLWLAHLPALDI